MSNRYTNLDLNLTTLQDLIKRDPSSYKEEFLEQYRHYENTLALFQLQPDLDSSRLINVVTFLSHVAYCYPSETKRLFDDIAEVLRKSAPLLNADLRLTLCKCLVMLRNKRLAPVLPLLQLFFDLLPIRDKTLRKFIFDSTISYAKYLHTKRRGSKSAGAVQSYVFGRLQDSQAVVVRTALLICIDLYRRKIWQDAKTANAIGRACFNGVTKIFVAACKFFLGKDTFGGDNSRPDASSSSDDDDGGGGNNKSANSKSLKEIMVGYRVGKKTRKRTKRMEKAKGNLQKVQEKSKKKSNRLKTLDFSALHYLYDPQEFAEGLMKKVQKNSDRFEVKLILMALIARLVGIHKLQLLNFYPFLQKYLQPHQRDVTKILLFAAQASHDLVPPDCIQSLVMTIVNNFVTDRASSEAITVGLNSVREIVAQCPLAIDQDLLQDLVEYKKYKNKNVSMAAKSLIQTFRAVNPSLLKTKDRGKPTEAMKELKPITMFAENRPLESIPGAECLIDNPSSVVREADNDDDDDDDDGQSEEDYESDLDDLELKTDSENEDSEVDVSQENTSTNRRDEDSNEKGDSVADNNKEKLNIAESRILSQEEFRKIAAYQLKKQTTPNRKRKADSEEVQEESDPDSDDDDDVQRGELATLRDIEHLHKRPKQDKQQRMESVKRGREGREKFGRPKDKGPHVGRTNKNLAKRKAFTMVKQKQRGKSKKRSFRDKQKALRQYLLKQKKMR